MLLVSRAQREQVGEPAFVDRVVAHFLRYHLEAVHMLPDDVLRRRVEHGIAKGRGYGLTWEYSLTVFVAHMIRIHPRFDEHPAVQRELRDPSREPDRRIDALVENLTPDEWEDAASRGDPEAYWRDVGAGAPPGGG
ncbi:hypothetical protein WME94_06575 [Sorangium sp. So ce429]